MRSSSKDHLYLRSQEEFPDGDLTRADWDLGDWMFLMENYDRNTSRHPTLQGAQVWLMDDRNGEQVLIQKWVRK